MKSQKLRGSGSQAGKAQLAGLLLDKEDHLAKSGNAVSVRARSSRRALHTSAVGIVALLAKVGLHYLRSAPCHRARVKR